VLFHISLVICESVGEIREIYVISQIITDRLQSQLYKFISALFRGFVFSLLILPARLNTHLYRPIFIRPIVYFSSLCSRPKCL